MGLTGIFGGSFNPPHVGHLALARAAIERFSLERLLIRVIDAPGHKTVATPGATRAVLAELAFAEIAEAEVSLDRHARTVDSLEEIALDDPLFLIGADEFATFLDWKAPERVLELARLGVATRPGYARELLGPVLAALSAPERVEFFEIEPSPVSSSEIRRRVAAGASISGMVPEAVEAEIARLGLYVAG